jgi:hypothetical protein
LPTAAFPRKKAAALARREAGDPASDQSVAEATEEAFPSNWVDPLAITSKSSNRGSKRP